jgi:hypothetical protein
MEQIPGIANRIFFDIRSIFYRELLPSPDFIQPGHNVYPSPRAESWL